MVVSERPGVEAVGCESAASHQRHALPCDFTVAVVVVANYRCRPGKPPSLTLSPGEEEVDLSCRFFSAAAISLTSRSPCWDLLVFIVGGGGGGKGCVGDGFWWGPDWLVVVLGARRGRRRRRW